MYAFSMLVGRHVQVKTLSPLQNTHLGSSGRGQDSLPPGPVQWSVSTCQSGELVILDPSVMVPGVIPGRSQRFFEIIH